MYEKRIKVPKTNLFENSLQVQHRQTHGQYQKYYLFANVGVIILPLLILKTDQVIFHV